MVESSSFRISLVISNYYPDISERLRVSALRFLQDSCAVVSTTHVMGVLEIPTAISILDNSPNSFDGYVALGCVIRGETSHYDVVCQNSSMALTHLGINKGICIGNGILTVENLNQAEARSEIEGGRNAGEWAAKATINLVELKYNIHNNNK